MAAQKKRKYEHHGIVFSVVPGSKRERLLTDMFQAHDRAASNPRVVEPDADHSSWLFPLVVGAVSGTCAGILIGWSI